MMRRNGFTLCIALMVRLLLCAPAVHATLFGRVRGVVHDAQHRPISGASVELTSSSTPTTHFTTSADGTFSFAAIALGQYTLTVSAPGFETVHESLTLGSDTSAVVHLELPVAGPNQSVTVTAAPATSAIDTATPTTLISREQIEQTPGALRTNSMAMITDYVPGAYMTHDMLHMRGGHQVSWQIDGVEIPNTNIASNVGAQIDPRDIQNLEVQRGSYTADVGDRTYGVFNVVPRTGFDMNRQAELVTSAGNFLSTDDQLNFGDHTQKFAYYASLNGNRSDYGLAPPIGAVHHDAANGYGGFLSLIDNHTSADQLRLVAQLRQDYFQIPYDPDPNDFENQQYDSSGLRDGEHETDGFAAFTWLHTFSPSLLLQLSPFYHDNSANYDSNPSDTPVATTVHRSSKYTGGQFDLSDVVARNTVHAGVYSFVQHDNELFGGIFNDGSGTPSFTQQTTATAAINELYLSDSFKATSWLTLLGGLRYSHFSGSFTEAYAEPRTGVAVRVPYLHWVFRAFYGRFYQPPPLLTASGPVLQLANANNTGFAPLHGERDEERQFGVQIPLHGWTLDADTFHTRINNFLDHSNIGDSSIYFPVTVDGALVRAWELTLTSPLSFRYGQLHLAYSNQIAEQRGNITGGLICTPIGDPSCDAGFAYTPVDHDQRNTLNVGFNARLPLRLTASTNVNYGSGFVNGDPDPTTPYPNNYLPQHTTFDLALGRSFGEAWSATVTATNVANRRVLLDNSLTFGGFHFNDPRQINAELHYRFKF